MGSYLKDFFRINFVGKPFELNKLVYDNSIILKSQAEAEKVIKACRIFQGWQYWGLTLTAGAVLALSRSNKVLKLERKKQLTLVLIGFLPATGFYIYSHFSYWPVVSDIVKTTREREREYQHLDKNKLDEYKILHNQSKDYHKYIQQNIGIISSLAQVFKN